MFPKTRSFSLAFVASMTALVAALAACAPPPLAQKAASAAEKPAAEKPAAGPKITLASQSGDFQAPLDSIPDPSAQVIYFTAQNGKGKGVFQVPAAGGAVAEVAVGAPFVAPTGIGMAPDGQQLFVADPQAGSIFSIAIGPSAKAEPKALAGSTGSAPMGMDVVSENGQTVIYFSGKDAQDGQPAVFKLNAAGTDKATLVYKGAPLKMPDGVAVTPDGTVYVADHTAAGGEMGQVFKIAGGKATPLVLSVRTGNPAGIALTKDGSTLLVSALQADGKSDQVLVVNTATGDASAVTDVVGQNSAAGGVHRAFGLNVFSWADLTHNRNGGVFRVEP